MDRFETEQKVTQVIEQLTENRKVIMAHVDYPRSARLQNFADFMESMIQRMKEGLRKLMTGGG
jgi:hypothetical protein